jgi:hypothetical protein
MIRLWRAITDAAGGIVTELNKLIETLRADLRDQRWWWSRQASDQARSDAPVL